MTRRALTLPGALLLFGVFPTLVYAHICHSIFRTPGLMAVRPEKDVTTISKSDRFSVYVQNNYQSPVTKVRLIAKATDPDAKVTVAPEAIGRLRPGERAQFTVDVNVGDDTRRRDFAIQFSIDARQFRVHPVTKPTDADLRKALKSASLSGQVMAAEALSRRGDKEMTEFLKRVISVQPTGRPRPTYRLENAGRAARYLGRMGREDFAPFLRERLAAEQKASHTGDQGGRRHFDEKDAPARHREWIRGNILIGLGLLGLKEDVPLLSMAAKTEKGFVQVFAVLALAIRGDKRSQARLTSGLGSADPRIRIASAWGRGIAKDPGAIKILEQAADQRAGNKHSSRAFAGDALVHLAALDQ
ncbi:MAG: hypothetical protein ACYTFI_00570 [Planctomycetota bacterium]|jgi:hypothetical protein